MKISIEDRALFDQVLRKFEGLRPSENPDAPDVIALREEMSVLSDIAAASDTLQKHLMSTELKIMRSNNPDAMASALMLFLAIGMEIGSQLPMPVSATVN